MTQCGYPAGNQIRLFLYKIINGSVNRHVFLYFSLEDNSQEVKIHLYANT